MNQSEIAARLKKFEGCISYMYKCTGGEVTVGVGHAIQTAMDAGALSWRINGSAATAEQAAADYARVAAAQKGMPAEKYEALTRCRMADPDIEKLLAGDIQIFENKLSAVLPKLAQYPEPAQQALFDMAYNLGIAGLLKFHKMLAAVDAGNWETAAAESRRNGIGDGRNAEIAALFRQAAA
jgi:GH24 family phage-related lysozyme (muramidase)